MTRPRLVSIALLLCVMISGCSSLSPGPGSFPTVPSIAATVTPTVTASPAWPQAATPASGYVTITYWEEEADDGDVLLDALSAAFMARNPDIRVERAHFRYEELRDLYRAAALSNQAPDLVRCPSEFTGPFSGLGIVRPLDDLVGEEVIAAFLPGSLEAAKLNGRIWGLPDNYDNHLMLIYNQEQVDQVPGETGAWLLQLKDLSDPSSNRFGLVFNLDEPYWLIPWLGGFGGWPLDEASNPTLNSTAMIDALRFVADLRLVHRVVPLEASYEQAYEMFLNGQAAYVIDGAWNLGRYVGAGMDIGIEALPRVSTTGRYPTPMTTGKYWLLSDQTNGASLDASLRFLEFMTSAEAQEIWLSSMQSGADLRHLPSNAEVAASQYIAQEPFLAGSMSQLVHGRGLPPAQEMSCIWSAMRPELAAVLDGTATPEDAAAAMQAEAERCVAEMRAL